jgi:subtilisin family serine protease
MNTFRRRTLTLELLSVIVLAGYGSSHVLSNNSTDSKVYKGTKKIVQVSKGFNIDRIKASTMSGRQIIPLGNGGYIIISNGADESQLQNQLENQLQQLQSELQNQLEMFNNIKFIENPQNVGIIQPIDKTPVQGNFNIPGNNTSTDNALNDPGYKSEWDIFNTESNKAWSLVKQKREIKVAVLDTGVDYTHPDLKNRVLTNLGYNFVDNNSDTMDDNGHGTHVSGIIAAEADNNQGVAGIDGTLDVKIIPVKVLDANGEGDSNIIAKGIRYAVDKGADIINLSFGSPQKSADIEDAIQYAKSKGVFVVAAAGNDNADCDNSSPAGDSGVYTVAAVNQMDKKAYFSDYGNSVQIAAPGVGILSTVPGGQYEAWSGTSMAAPVVSGIAAMVKAEDPSLTPDQIATVLDETAKKINTNGKNVKIGYGLVDAYKAIEKVKTME